MNIQTNDRVDGADPAQVSASFEEFERTLSDQQWHKLYDSAERNSMAMGSEDDFILLLTYAPTTKLISLGVETPCVPPQDPEHPLDG